MKDKSYSALSNAALRAAESYYPEDERLFYDEAAFNLMPPLWKLFLKLMKFAPLREMIFSKRDKEMGSPWKTGFKSIEIKEILKSRGLELIEDVGRAEYHKRYSHLTKREISIYDGERTAYALKK